ncbi:hypothetical protein D9758_016382 [Tetrapyrgos nigripes]|uniref:Fungal-type protein kinase domain-containing protein n=1 Tax=Tetrapyrgos nigripes TaxID=182062 RepID=A0A8H5FGW4_9AGAR|nr:hypothetical protein D9758_016382 [Tetrapyrgos nigripes]
MERTVALRDLDSGIFEMPLTDFCETYLQFGMTDDNDVSPCMKELTPNGYWAAIPAVLSSGQEDTTFSSTMPVIVEDVRNYANGEWKFDDSDESVFDNRGKLFGAAAHLMNTNPCRHHVFSISVEKLDTRLWYFSRSYVVKSKPFNLRKEPRWLIRFIVAMSFGTLDELGYDETVTRHYDTKGEIFFYVYQVQGQYFRTCRLLCEYFPASVSGRAARVWVVQECDASGVVKGKDEHVLKDYWLNERQKEWEIQGDIFSRLERLKQELLNPSSDKLLDNQEERQLVLDALANYREYFITIMANEIVRSSIPVLETS